MHEAITREMKRCITDCHECDVTCLSMAMIHCLEMGAKHTEPPYFKLMMDCAQICATAIDFMARMSAHHAHICRECAEICRACAASCEQIDVMEACVDACRKRAESCDKMMG